MEQDFGGFASTPYSNGELLRQRQYRRSKSNYYSTNERMRRSQGPAVNQKVLNGLVFLTIFFAILTSIAYIGIAYTVICSLGISIILMKFFPEKLAMFFPEEDSAPGGSQRAFTPRGSLMSQRYDRYSRGYRGLSSGPSLYSQDFCNMKPVRNTGNDQTPVDFTFDSSLIGNDSDDTTQARLAKMNFPDMKYKSAIMSYGDLNSDSYIRMSKNFLKETPLYEHMDILTSNLKVWLSVHVISRAAKVIDDYKNRSEITDTHKEFKDAPSGVSQKHYEDRIKKLSSGSYLTLYDGNVNKNSDSPDKPSDAYIIMYLFSTYFTSKVHFSFSDTYIITPYQAQSILRGENSNVYLCLTRTSPTHYDVISHGKVHTVLPGANNVFHAIILFFYYILTKNNGYLLDGNQITEITEDIKMNEILSKKSPDKK